MQQQISCQQLITLQTGTLKSQSNRMEALSPKLGYTDDSMWFCDKQKILVKALGNNPLCKWKLMMT